MTDQQFQAITFLLFGILVTLAFIFWYIIGIANDLYYIAEHLH